MTPKQLEAHRVRFEQRYAKEYSLRPNYIVGKRFGDGYEPSVLHHAWQAYQWAIEDTAPLGDAQPVGWILEEIEGSDYFTLNQGLEKLALEPCGPFTKSMLMGVLSKLNAPQVDAEIAQKEAKHVEERVRRCQGPRCMYVVGLKGSAHSKECLTQAGEDQGWTPTEDELANAGPSSDAAPQVEAAPVASYVNFLPHDNHLRFVQRVLEGDAPKSDKDDAAQMVRDMRRSIYTAAAQAAPVQQPVATSGKYSDLLSMAIGVIMSQRSKIGYTDKSPVAKLVAEAVEYLKDWPFPESAQPVEVQRVPLTDDERSTVVEALEDWSESAQHDLAQQLRSTHSIKPTGEKGAV